MTEAALHEAVANLLNTALPPHATWHHSPNEGKRGWKAQRALKTHGTQAGWPDIEIIYRGRALFIELKAPGKYLTAVQKDMHKQLTLAGAAVHTCRSLEEVSIFLAMAMGTDWRASVGTAA